MAAVGARCVVRSIRVSQLRSGLADAGGLESGPGCGWASPTEEETHAVASSRTRVTPTGDSRQQMREKATNAVIRV